ncbi:site-specific DNA-methyltransferase, partial [Candidatus Nomurabacteria bacterium]|nr:site-specific DNA-methyltransferase [Candidatus Nomurabacteria bacterium]
ELTWIGKDIRPNLEPRVLIEDPDKSYHSDKKVTDNDLFDNKLIFGDNLLALRALEQEYTGKVKCIYIDPPFNTGKAFERYDDSVEHSVWLNLIYQRLIILRSLLDNNGIIWVELDENEHAYCKVMLDEIMGRANYIATVVYRRRMSQANLSSSISVIHNFLLVYAKDKSKVSFNKVMSVAEGIGEYKNPDNDPRGPYATAPCSNKGGSRYPITTPSGIVHEDEWRFKQETYDSLFDDKRIFFPNNGKGKPRYKIFQNERNGVIPSSWWDEKELSTQNANKESEDMFDKVQKFDTPKPEYLIWKILSISSNQGDIVLDSFAGSGTTGAVAHKMGRKWIMVELGEHCHSHIINSVYFNYLSDTSPPVVYNPSFG